MKSIPICDLFYHVALNITRLMPETSNGNKYVFVVVVHYDKWCEARPVKEHDVINVAKFLEEEIICQFGVSKYILIDDGNEWMKFFDALCEDHGIIH
jgi:hypothetical protein